MFSIRLFFACRRWHCSRLSFYAPRVFIFSLCFAFTLPSDLIFFETVHFLRRPSPLLDYCDVTVTVQYILLTHPLKEEALWWWTGCLGSQREKLKQYLHCSLSSFSTGGIQSTQNGLGAQSYDWAGQPLAMYSLVMLLWTTSVLKEINLLTLECARFGDVYSLDVNTFYICRRWKPVSHTYKLACH